MASRARAGSPTYVLVLVLLAALAIGAAASTLAAPTLRAPSSGSGPFGLSSAVVGYALVAGIAAVLAFLLYRRLTTPTLPVPNRLVVSILVVVLLCALFVVIAHAYVPAASGSGGSPVGSAPTGAPNSTSSNNSSVLTGYGGFQVFNFTLPPWTLFVAVLAVALVAAVLATPQARDLLFAGRARRPGPEFDAEARVARTALARAAGSIAGGGDPRAAIIALYTELLERLTPLVGDLDPATPEEIRSRHLLRLGIRPEAALALTRLFEEARYSPHPIDAADAGRALEVIRTAQADLDAATPRP
ncbi:MAG TPA: DUF4129 domain-containing protein [Thermoplasmata archaeon]|nr:DUF4129 domain-containing protein [Thermoplasmata archaeon]